MLLIFYAVLIIAFYAVCAGISALYDRWTTWASRHLH